MSDYPVVTEKMRDAMAHWSALTPRERQALACWFCQDCQEELPPGAPFHNCPLRQADTEPAPPLIESDGEAFSLFNEVIDRKNCIFALGPDLQEGGDEK